MSRKAFIFWCIIVPDVLLLYVSLWLAIAVRYQTIAESSAWALHVRTFTPLYPVWLLVLFINGSFDIHSFRRYSTLTYRLFVAMAVNVLVSVMYFYFQPSLIVTPRRFLLIHVGLTYVLILGWHLVLKYFLRNRLQERLYLLAESNELEPLKRDILAHDYMGYSVLDTLTEHSLRDGHLEPQVSVIVSEQLQDKPEVVSKLYEMRTRGMVLYHHHAFYEELLRQVYLPRLSYNWFLVNISYKDKRLYTLAKRCVDVVCAVLGLLVALPSFPFIAALIRLTYPGPIFFVQERVGEGGKLFRVYKYRTMSGPVTNTWTSPDDKRVTFVGRLLRKSRIDELPQCINLFLGTMSVVGPRPEQPHLVEKLREAIPFYDERHIVKPGITGWAQINDTYAATVEETKQKLQYDLYYIKHRSFLFDLEIILKTIYYVLSWKGR